MTWSDQVSTAEAPADYTHALTWLGGDRDLLMELTAMFLADYPRRMKVLEQAIADGDANAIEHTAHTIKGSVAGLGARSAQCLAGQLELLGKEERLPDMPAIFSALVCEIERLARHLRSPAWNS
jgi:HPt (histidine-containing phosphotransfer) domain-containing protein